MPRLPSHSETRSSLVMCAVVMLVVGWGWWAHDSDFPLLDPFSGLALWVLFVFVLAGFIQRPALRWNVRAALAFVPALALVGVEAYAASKAAEVDDRIVQSDDVLLRYHYRPGAEIMTPDRHEERINSLGLWDDEYVIPKPDGVFRIVVLGDSVPNDVRIPREARFHRVMFHALEERSDVNVEVINVSCEGYSTLQEVRLLERVGLRYEPDLVLLAYVLNDPFLQNGGHRRMGNSYAAFMGMFFLEKALEGSLCPKFNSFNQGYAYALMVGAPLERLALLSRLHGFRTLVAALPVVEDFADEACMSAYDRIGALAQAQSMPFLRVVDAFQGEDSDDYLKEGDSMDVTHPNAAGHLRMGNALADFVAPFVVVEPVAEPLLAEPLEPAEPATATDTPAR